MPYDNDVIALSPTWYWPITETSGRQVAPLAGGVNLVKGGSTAVQSINSVTGPILTDGLNNNASQNTQNEAFAAYIMGTGEGSPGFTQHQFGLGEWSDPSDFTIQFWLRTTSAATDVY